MRKRITPIVILLMLLVATLCCGIFAACTVRPGDTARVEDFVPSEQEGTEVVFELEGGSYRNSDRAVHVYYRFPEGVARKIVPFDKIFTTSRFERQKYAFLGWFRTRTEEDGKVVYSDEWDFENDELPAPEEGEEEEGPVLTLYASWDKILKHTYDVYYVDDSGEEVSLKMQYEAEEGATFNDGGASDYAAAKFKNKYTGHTVYCELDDEGVIRVQYYSDKECRTRWNPAFVHPGGETSTSVRVYVKFISGRYNYVATRDQLISALSDTTNTSIYLLDDIDMAGYAEKFYGFRLGAGADFPAGATFNGNGHTIRNITLSYEPSLNMSVVTDPAIGTDVLVVSLFGNLNRATIENLTIENVTVDIDATWDRIRGVWLAPLCVKAQNSTVRGVEITGTYKVTNLPSLVQEEDLEILTGTEDFIRPEGDASVFEDVSIAFTKETA